MCSSDLGSAVEEGTKDVPNVISTELEAPYVIGPVLVAAAAATRAGVDQLYIKPPVALDQFLDPASYFDGDLPETFTRPKTTGAAIPSGIIGAVRLYLTLASALPTEDAWKAALGWGNDVYVGARAKEGAPLCITWNVYGDNVAASQTLHDALKVWAATRVTAASVSVSDAKNPTVVSLCDPGPSITQTLLPRAPVDYLYTRAYVLGALIEIGRAHV